MRIRITALLPVLSLAVGASAKGPASARLTEVVGAVTVESGGSSRSGKKGLEVAGGDWIATEKGATAVLALPDGSQLKLTQLSRFQLELPEPDSPVTAGLLSLGGVFAKVAKVLPGARFEIRTEAAVASVRGTEFFTAFGRPGKVGRDLWVCVNKGAVAVTTNAQKTPLLVPAGKGILIKSGLDLTKPQAYEWTKKLNWNMDSKRGSVEDATNLDSAYSDLLDQDYR